MKEIRIANIIFSRNGNGFVTNKITLPVNWVKELGFNENDKKSFIEIFENRIIIRKVEKNMLLIKEQKVKHVSSYADYKLENGVLLFDEDWNGEIYRKGYDLANEKNTVYQYKPVRRFELDKIDLDSIEENSTEWEYALEIIGFEEF